MIIKNGQLLKVLLLINFFIVFSLITYAQNLVKGIAIGDSGVPLLGLSIKDIAISTKCNLNGEYSITVTEAISISGF